MNAVREDIDAVSKGLLVHLPPTSTPFLPILAALAATIRRNNSSMAAAAAGLY